MTLVNLTPHAINFCDESGTVYRTVEPSGTLARVSTSTVHIGEFDGLPITATEFGDVQGLPEPSEGTAYLVSSLVAQRVPDRGDVFIPNESVRDSKGRVVGCRSLGRISPTLSLFSYCRDEYDHPAQSLLGKFFTISAARAAAEKDFLRYPDSSTVYSVEEGGSILEEFYFEDAWDGDDEVAELHVL